MLREADGEERKLSMQSENVDCVSVWRMNYQCLVECPMFSEERKTCLPASLIRRPSMFEFVKFMKSNRYEDCVSAAILCKRVMNAYKRKM